MTTLKRLAMVSALGIALAGNTSVGQGAPGLTTDGVAALSPANTPPLPVGGKPDNKPGKDPSEKPDKPDKPDKPGRGEYPDSIKKMVEEIKAAQLRYLQEQKDMRDKLKDATAQQRESIRIQMREKRDLFLEQQKELSEEVRKRVVALKDQLKDHRDVIDEAKEKAKGTVNRRKGGED